MRNQSSEKYNMAYEGCSRLAETCHDHWGGMGWARGNRQHIQLHTTTYIAKRATPCKAAMGARPPLAQMTPQQTMPEDVRDRNQ